MGTLQQKKLALDYGIHTTKEIDACINYTPPYPTIRKFREDEQLCIRVLSRWSRILERWRKLYAPAKDCDIWDLRFVEATKELSTMDYFLDCLTVGTLEERVAMVDFLLDKGIIRGLQDRLREEETEAYGRADESCS